MRRIFAFSLCLLLLAGALPAALAVPESVDYDVLVTPEDNIGLNMREDRLEEEVWAWNSSAASRVHSMEFTAGWETSSGTGR